MKIKKRNLIIWSCILILIISCNDKQSSKSELQINSQEKQNRQVRLEFRLAETSPSSGLIPIIDSKDGTTIFLHDKVELDNNDIETAELSNLDPYESAVLVTFNKKGAEKLLNLTSKKENMNKLLAIIADKKLITAPVIVSPLNEGKARISGGLTKEEAVKLVTSLSQNNPHLDTDLKKMDQNIPYGCEEALNQSSQGSIKSEPIPITDYLVVLPGALKPKYFKTEQGEELEYFVEKKYPGVDLIQQVIKKVNENGWTPLKEGVLNPGSRTSFNPRIPENVKLSPDEIISFGWSSYINSSRKPKTYVFSWYGEWRNKNGDILIYSFMYTDLYDKDYHDPEYAHMDKPKTKCMKVIIIYKPEKKVRELMENLKRFQNKSSPRSSVK